MIVRSGLDVMRLARALGPMLLVLAVTLRDNAAYAGPIACFCRWGCWVTWVS